MNIMASPQLYAHETGIWLLIINFSDKPELYMYHTACMLYTAGLQIYRRHDNSVVWPDRSFVTKCISSQYNGVLRIFPVFAEMKSRARNRTQVERGIDACVTIKVTIEADDCVFDDMNSCLTMFPGKLVLHAYSIH